jgi:2-keto-4-pentenoate hydratase/2-oxohepta-3-ene-1,7-dioic acid hydratase in catechol pathway
MRFKLGTFAVAGEEASFPGLVLADSHGADRVVPLAHADFLLTPLNLRLRQPDSLLCLLENWDLNFQALAILCQSSTPQLLQASLPLAAVHIRAPLAPPRQIFCTIANFRSQIIESIMDNGAPPHTDSMDAEARRAYAGKIIEERLKSPPYICFKLPSTVIGPTDSLEIPGHTQRLDWELELGVVMSRPAHRVSRTNAMSYVAGYVMVNDITARDLVRRTDAPAMGTDWLQSKNGPGFLPMGPYLVPAAFLPDPYSLKLTLSLNDRLMQNGVVADMLFDIATQIEYLSEYVQLLPGDVICTGTPAGCGTHHKRYLQPGDVMHANIPELGSQHTACVEEAARSL